jgi:tRNA(fMet)-specific endonuclease VapC
LTKYLLDANAVIDWLKDREPAPALLAELSSRGDRLAINGVSLAETYSGIDPSNLERIDGRLASFEYWPVDWAVARLAGQYRYQYFREGRSYAIADMIIGAHALSEDATLITDNVRDFPIPGLKILRYRDWKPGQA